MVCVISLMLEIKYKVFHKEIKYLLLLKHDSSIDDISFFVHKEDYLEISNCKYSVLEEPLIIEERLQ